MRNVLKFQPPDGCKFCGGLLVQKEELIRSAAMHAASGLELLNKLMAVQSFTESGMIDPSAAQKEMIDLIAKFKVESEKTVILVDRFLADAVDTP